MRNQPNSGDDADLARNRMLVAEGFEKQRKVAEDSGKEGGHCTVFINRHSLRIYAGAYEYAALRRILCPRDPSARLWLNGAEVTGQVLTLAGGEAFFSEGRSAGN